MEKQKLVIIVLGKQNAGKSSTWYDIFGRVIRTGWKRLTLQKETLEVFVRNSSFEEAGEEIDIDVFVKNSSHEEEGTEPEDFFDMIPLPDLIFCSVQYTEKGMRTIEWFQNNGYYLYIQWLNPGYYHNEYPDFLEFEKKFGPVGTFIKHSGKEKENRSGEILKFLSQWIRKKGA